MNTSARAVMHSARQSSERNVKHRCRWLKKPIGRKPVWVTARHPRLELTYSWQHGNRDDDTHAAAWANKNSSQKRWEQPWCHGCFFDWRLYSYGPSSYLHDRSAIRSRAGTPQVPRVSGDHSMGGPHLLNVEIQNRRGCYKQQGVPWTARTGTPGIPSQRPRSYPLGFHFNIK